MPNQQPLTYAIDPSESAKIRSYVNAEHDRTGVSKRKIVTDLLILALKLKDQL